MEEYVLNTEKRELHGKAAKETALSYTWEKACAPLVKQLKRAMDDKDE